MRAMFERFWRRLRGQTGKDPEGQDNRRAYPRYPADVDADCEVVGGAVIKLRVRVRNVSRGGINFVCDQKLEPGVLVRIDLPKTGSSSEATVLTCVMHSNLQPDGQYSVGCSFSDELGTAELHALGASKETAEEADKRAWKRFEAQGVAEYLLLPPTGQPAKQAQIINISPTGIGLLVAEKVEPGTILDLLLKTHDGKRPSFDILACVVYMSPRDEEGWVAGCHFIRELEEADLKRLM
jgi:hypothetical protein